MKKTTTKLVTLLLLAALGALGALGGGCAAEMDTAAPGEGETTSEPIDESSEALTTISREQIISIAQSAVGYSYYWGHGRWRTDGASHGSCSGSCPNCSHSGSYGADCSGLAAKAWQVPSTSAVDVDTHPYSTWNFRYETTHWDVISRNSLMKGDALVQNDGDSGHIVIYEHTTAAGQYSVYECRGCSYGCVHNTRSFGPEYIAIRRRQLESVGADGCTNTQRSNCGAFGCACVNGQCNGGFCDGNGCTAQQTNNCAAFGCGCVDGQCNGGFCDGTGCTAKRTNDCGGFGCGCVDMQCSGGYCDGTGCTAKRTKDCGAFGCGCVDGQCSGGFCPGTGCTVKRTNDCGAFGCGCAVGECSGGFCE